MSNRPNLIKQRRIEAGLTQAALSEIAGISQQMLSKLEKGERQLTLSTAEAISAALKCAPGDIMPRLKALQSMGDEQDTEAQLILTFRQMPKGHKTLLLSMARLMAS